jgi:hypothetical protein
MQLESKGVGIPAETVYAAPLHECVREVAYYPALLYATVHGRADPHMHIAIFESKFYI